MSTNLIPTDGGLEDWVSQAEAARLRGVSRQAVSNLIRRGKLNTLTVGGQKFVRREEVLNFNPSKAGRPKKTDE